MVKKLNIGSYYESVNERLPHSNHLSNVQENPDKDERSSNTNGQLSDKS